MAGGIEGTEGQRGLHDAGSAGPALLALHREQARLLVGHRHDHRVQADDRERGTRASPTEPAGSRRGRPRRNPARAPAHPFGEPRPRRAPGPLPRSPGAGSSSCGNPPERARTTSGARGTSRLSDAGTLVGPLRHVKTRVESPRTEESMSANRSVRLVAPLILAALLLPCASGAADRPPNVVLVFADDLGLRGRRRVRRRGLPNAPHRPSRRRGGPLHRLLRGPGGLHRVPGGAPDRLLPAARRPHRRRRPPGPARHLRGRDDPRRDAEGPRLRHRDLRQVAPGPPPAVPAHPPRLRRLLRAALLERHVALPPRAARRLSPAAPHRGRGDDRDQPRPVEADRRVRAAGGGLHRGAPRRALLRLPRPLDAPRADLRVGGLSRAHEAEGSSATSSRRSTTPWAGSSRPSSGSDSTRARW